ncbi:MAG: lipopolysaccharide heptosyltransferase II [Candidatus Marinimicrobia bacterium]|nr:lipopolysaccharide heptosyltransferase II [Candidatus Neomarinimicrobiota bacterium]
MSNRIIIRAPNWIGDAVMAVPMIQQTRRTFPRAHLTVLARDWVAPVYSYLDVIDDIISLSRNQKGNLYSQNTLINELREKQYDMGFILPDSFSSAWILFQSKIKLRIGYKGQLRAWMLTERLDLGVVEKMHRTDKYLKLLEPYATRISYGVSPQLSVKKVQKNSLPEGWDIDLIHIGVNPYSIAPSRRWPIPYWRELIRRLRDPLLQFLIFGSSDNLLNSKELTDGLDANIINLTGKLTLKESISCISQCNLFISNDSGPMHIADGVGVPTIGIFGAGDWTQTGLRSPHSENLASAVYCSPCKKNYCINKHEPLLCLYSLTAEQIAEKAYSILL